MSCAWEQLCMLELERTILKSGRAAISKNGQMIDQQDYPDAELFSPEAVEQILKNLDAEEIILKQRHKEGY